MSQCVCLFINGVGQPLSKSCAMHMVKMDTGELQKLRSVVARQRHPNGNPELVDQIKRHFVLPPATGSAGEANMQMFKQWIYLTQVWQMQL